MRYATSTGFVAREIGFGLLGGRVRITYGTHALGNLVDRALERVWIERTVAEPEETETDPKHPERRRAYRSVPERDGRMLRVVYVPTEDGVHIVTAFFDRSRRRSREVAV